MENALDSDELAARYRAKALRQDSREILISRLAGSDQEADLTVPPNCAGFGRLRHFRTVTDSAWLPNPLPIEPARSALGLGPTHSLRAQVFQNAVCNWRCWYCYVPFNLLAGDETRSGWWTADALVEMFETQPDRPSMIDLTGGQPDLIPEWVPWTMDALEARGLRDDVYLWSDDNLSNDYFWRYLSTSQIDQIVGWRNYGRVCCFKGFDRASFAFNTAASELLFDRQLELFSRLAALGLDLYAYVTLTAPDLGGVERGVCRFMDQLQTIDELLPLRTVPLEIQVFSPVRRRLNTLSNAALLNQALAMKVWRRELERRFSSAARDRPITQVRLAGRVR